jgi:hypothetical protein
MGNMVVPTTTSTSGHNLEKQTIRFDEQDTDHELYEELKKEQELNKIAAKSEV